MRSSLSNPKQGHIFWGTKPAHQHSYYSFSPFFSSFSFAAAAASMKVNSRMLQNSSRYHTGDLHTLDAKHQPCLDHFPMETTSADHLVTLDVRELIAPLVEELHLHCSGYRTANNRQKYTHHQLDMKLSLLEGEQVLLNALDALCNGAGPRDIKEMCHGGLGALEVVELSIVIRRCWLETKSWVWADYGAFTSPPSALLPFPFGDATHSNKFCGRDGLSASLTLTLHFAFFLPCLSVGIPSALASALLVLRTAPDLQPCGESIEAQTARVLSVTPHGFVGEPPPNSLRAHAAGQRKVSPDIQFRFRASPGQITTTSCTYKPGKATSLSTARLSLHLEPNHLRNYKRQRRFLA
ncbi:hypothetical protein BU23DRAFT_563875 [Bimuria novae-zelandiae CBS 107.79]|uniref:Uncharacterized protein n=1 Tax=Bimuria novae-zelandiae CBS 107.79 TaxID=1447943 RepID=A0A6A5VMT2_9PLEO|nr:hypothetical protein BU23DRAFT_563875 [Bimuria novae-zelandiae CBS 107.79]